MAGRAFLPGSPIMRWLPTIAVTLAPIGWALAAAGRHYDQRIWQSGELAPALSMLIVSYLALVQPRPLDASPDTPLDERELGIRMLANMRGAIVTLAPPTLICLYMSYAVDGGWWMPTGRDWASFLFLIYCWFFGMPMVFANWQTPAPIHDGDDE